MNECLKYLRSRYIFCTRQALLKVSHLIKVNMFWKYERKVDSQN